MLREIQHGSAQSISVMESKFLTDIPIIVMADPWWWQVKLSNIENMDLTTKRGHLTIRLAIHKENHRVLLRSAQDTRVWFNMIMVSSNSSLVFQVAS